MHHGGGTQGRRGYQCEYRSVAALLVSGAGTAGKLIVESGATSDARPRLLLRGDPPACLAVVQGPWCRLVCGLCCSLPACSRTTCNSGPAYVRLCGTRGSAACLLMPRARQGHRHGSAGRFTRCARVDSKQHYVAA